MKSSYEEHKERKWVEKNKQSRRKSDIKKVNLNARRTRQPEMVLGLCEDWGYEKAGVM
jgi:hypothetical protein